MTQTATAAPEDALRAQLRRFTPAQLREFCSGLDTRDLAVVERLFSEDHADHWRSDPASTAAYLTRNEEDPFIVYPYTALLSRWFADAVEGRRPRQVWNLPSQHGKALALDTPLPTPTGWTTMGECRRGDWLLDDLGRPCQVTAKSPVWPAVPWCFQAANDSGDVVITSADHEWRARPIDREEGLFTSAQLFLLLAARAGTRRRIAIDRSGILQLPTRALVIDPYVLGAWLGDGTSTDGVITAAHEDAKHLRAKIEEAGFCTSDRQSSLAFGIRGLKVQLRALGVLGNKHVPADYLRASAEQRRALLQGLVDTDGHVAPDGQVEFCNTRRGLVEAVVELVASLGGKAQIIEGRATLRGRDCGPKWRAMFYLEDAASLPRKALLCRRSARPHAVAFAPCEPVETQCLQVDSPSSMFLCGRSMMPTHNSFLASQWGPAWALDRDPRVRIILASYGDELAGENADAVREILRRYHEELRVHLRPDRQERSRFKTPEGGGIHAAGIDSGITGFPANGVVLDDPFKNWQEAHSAARRLHVLHQFKSVLRQRQTSDDFWMIVVQTRWHESDLTASLLEEAEHDGEEWELIRLPEEAEAPVPNATDRALRLPDPLGREPGETLGKFSAAAYAGRKASATSYLWASMHQQRPSPEEGTELLREWWRLEVSPPPRYDEAVTSWDMKLKSIETGDYVVGQFWGRAASDYWLAGTLRGKWNQPTTECAIVLLAIRHPQATRHYIENTGNGPEVMAALRAAHPGYEVSAEIAGLLGMTVEERQRVAAVRRRGMGNLLPVTVKGPKPVRARAVTGYIEAGNVHLAPMAEPWVGAFVDECAAFPNGAHDDQVDAMSQALAKLTKGPAKVTVPEGYVQRPPIRKRASGVAILSPNTVRGRQ